MISCKIYDTHNRWIATHHGATMAQAVSTAISRAMHLRPSMDDNLYLRDCLGGLRAEIIMRDGKPYARNTP